MKPKYWMVFLGLFTFFFLEAQDKVGIGVTKPTEKLEVSGMIFSNQQGFKFPDNTVQTSAAYNTNTSDAALPKLLGYLKANLIEGPLTRDLDFKHGITMKNLDSLMPIYAHDLEISRDRVGTSYHATFGPLQVISDISLATSDIFEIIAYGKIIPVAHLYLLEDDGGTEKVYAEITITTSFIESYNHNQVFTGNAQYAHLSGFKFNFETIEITTYHVGKIKSYCWNLATNRPC